MIPPNDWEIRKCLVLSGSLLLALLGLIGLAALGFEILVLRQVVGFLFLTFIPGILILRVLRVHNVHVIESLLYSVGLSLAFVMMTGVMANFALPPLGVSRPIALMPLIIITTVFLLILCVLAYVRDKGFRSSSRSDNQASKSIWQSFNYNPAPYLLATLLPLLAILGASLVNAYQNNLLLVVLIIIVAITIGLVAFNKFIPTRVYPFMIFMMALALIWQTTFISDYLVGSDIHTEHLYAVWVIENGFWNAAAPSNVNSCLSIVMLAPVYSLLLNTDIVWLFKMVYPLLFALMPLALFRVFRLQIKPQYAFLAAVFFITMPMFMMDMAQLVRQQVSELFFVLVILLMVDRRLAMIQRAFMVFIFGCGVVVSYYGLGTGYTIGFLAIGALVLIIIKSRPGRAIWQWLIGKSNSLPADLATPGAFNKRSLVIIVCLGLAFMFGYYGIVTGGSSLRGTEIAGRIAKSTVTQIASGVTIDLPPSDLPPSDLPPEGLALPAIEPSRFVQNLITRFPMLDPLKKEPLVQTALGLDFASASPGGKVWRVFQYLVQLCLLVGFIRLVFRPATLGKFKAEYLALTIVGLIILLGIFLLPGHSYGLGATRIWQISLLLLSPLFIFGGAAIARGIVKLVSTFRRWFALPGLKANSPALLRFPVLLIMIPYFIFNSGLVFEFSKSQTTYFIDMPYSISLSSHRVDITSVKTKQDVAAADWLCQVAIADYPIYTDHHAGRLFRERPGCYRSWQQFRRTTKTVPSPSYIFLRAWNTEKRVLTFAMSYAARQSINFANFPELMKELEKSDRIYDNGGAGVLMTDELGSVRSSK